MSAYKATNRKTGQSFEFDFNGSPSPFDMKTIIAQNAPKQSNNTGIQSPNNTNDLTPPTFGSEFSKLAKWGTTSIFPDAEKDISDFTARNLGEWSRAPTDFLIGGATSPIGLATLPVAGAAIGKSVWSRLAKKVPKPLTAASKIPLDKFDDVLDDAGRIIGKEKVIPKIQQSIPGFAPLGEFQTTVDIRPRVIQKIQAAVEKSKPFRSAQERSYTAELSDRVKLMEDTPLTSEANLHRRLSSLKGEYDKVDFSGIRPEFEPDDISELMTIIGNKKDFLPLQKTRTGVALTKLLDGTIPQKNEIELLEQAFGKEVSDAIAKALPKIDRKQATALQEAVNLPRAIWASYDLSIPLRQAKPLVHKKEFYTSLDDMFKSLVSEKKFQDVQNTIKLDPDFELAQKTNLFISDLEDLSRREEAVMSTWAEKIPGIRASNRASTAFLNKLRFDTFKSLKDNAIRAGIDPEDLSHMNKIAGFINNATGRGSLDASNKYFKLNLEKVGTELNGLFFSPRFISSRLNLLAAPVTYLNAPRQVQKEVVKSWLAMGAYWSTAAGVAKMAGADVGTEPTSSDFGKIKFGNTRLDTMGGFQQYMRVASQLATGETESPITGRTTKLGEGYRARTRYDVLNDFLTSKLAPVPGLAVTALKGKDFAGRPVQWTPSSFTKRGEIADRFIPNLAQTIMDLSAEDPNLLWLTVPAAFGEGVQIYDSPRYGNSMFKLPTKRGKKNYFEVK